MGHSYIYILPGMVGADSLGQMYGSIFVCQCFTREGSNGSLEKALQYDVKYVQRYNSMGSYEKS